MNSLDATLRQLERQQESLQYKLLRRRLGFGEVLPNKSSPKIFNTTQLLIDISQKPAGSGDGSGWGYGYGYGFRYASSLLCSQSGSGSGRGNGSGVGSGRR